MYQTTTSNLIKMKLHTSGDKCLAQ